MTRDMRHDGAIFRTRPGASAREVSLQMVRGYILSGTSFERALFCGDPGNHLTEEDREQLRRSLIPGGQ